MRKAARTAWAVATAGAITFIAWMAGYDFDRGFGGYFYAVAVVTVPMAVYAALANDQP